VATVWQSMTVTVDEFSISTVTDLQSMTSLLQQ
jgi:hypothetical protein